MRRREVLKRKVAALLENQQHLQKPTKLCEMLGVSKRQFYRWKSGTSLPRIDIIKKLCEVLDIDYLTFITSPEEDKTLLASLTPDLLTTHYKNVEGCDNLEAILGFCGV